MIWFVVNALMSGAATAGAAYLLIKALKTNQAKRLRLLFAVAIPLAAFFFAFDLRQLAAAMGWL